MSEQKAGTSITLTTLKVLMICAIGLGIIQLVMYHTYIGIPVAIACTYLLYRSIENE